MAAQLLKEIENAGNKEPSELRTLVMKWIEKLFPAVQSVGTETLQQWMEKKPEELLIFICRPCFRVPYKRDFIHLYVMKGGGYNCQAVELEGEGTIVPMPQDIRTAAEFAISHLPGAILVSAEGHALQELLKAQLMQEHNKGRRCIICYCSIGYRSSIAAQLANEILPQVVPQKSATSFDVYNIQGGLMKWASERRRMVDLQETPTQVVHTYSPIWSKLLELEFRAEI